VRPGIARYDGHAQWWDIAVAAEKYTTTYPPP
jgi:hypothetical protein